MTSELVSEDDITPVVSISDDMGEKEFDTSSTVA